MWGSEGATLTRISPAETVGTSCEVSSSWPAEGTVRAWKDGIVEVCGGKERANRR